MIAAARNKACPHPHKPVLENVDPLTADVFHSIGRIMHLNRLVMMKTVTQRGVQPQEAFALTYLSQRDGISQRELADGLHLSRPRVSAIMGALESQGLIARRPDEADRRLVRIFLTPEGRCREGEQRVVLGDYVERTIGALPESERRDLSRLLGELAERILGVLREPQTGGSDEGDEKP